MPHKVKYLEAFEAIKAETQGNKEEVEAVASYLMAIFVDREVPMSITTMAAMYSLAVSGATVLLRTEEGEEESDGIQRGDEEVSGEVGSGDH